MMDEFFPIGVTYRASLPKDERTSDLDEIADAGFNCIRIYAGMRKPDDLDQVLALASERDLKLLVTLDYQYTAVGSAEPCMESTLFDQGMEEFFHHRVEQFVKNSAVAAWVVPIPNPSDVDFEEVALRAIRAVDPDRPIIIESQEAPGKATGPVGISCRISDLPPIGSAVPWQKERYIGYMLRRAASVSNGTGAIAMSLQAGPSSEWVDFSPEDVGISIWTALANGARGLIFDRWDPGEVPTRDGSIKTIDGKCWHGLKRIMADIRRIFELPGLMRGRPVQAAAAVLAPSSILIPPPIGRIEGAYRLLADNFVSVAFLDDSSLYEDLNRYSVVYIPYLPSCSEQLGAALIRYVQDGGCLIAEAPVATTDEEGQPYSEAPGVGLSELFGCKVRNEFTERATPVATTGIAQGVFTYVGANLRFYVDGPVQTVDVQAGRSSITEFLDEKTLIPSGPAVIIGKYGEGKTCYIAASLSSAYYGMEHPYPRELISGVLDWFECPRQVEVTGLTKGFENEFEVGVIEEIDHSNRRAIICINHADRSVNPTLVLKTGPASVVRELITDTNVQTSIDADRLHIPTHVPERDVRVYYEIE